MQVYLTFKNKEDSKKEKSEKKGMQIILDNYDLETDQIPKPSILKENKYFNTEKYLALRQNGFSEEDIERLGERLEEKELSDETITI